MKKHQTTFHLDNKDRETIAEIRAYYGVTSDVDAIRIALREWKRHHASPTPAPEKDSHSSVS